MGYAVVLMIAAALLFIAGCSDTRDDGDGVVHYQLEPVAEPEALPYRFEILSSYQDDSGNNLWFVPIRLKSSGGPGMCRMADNWRSDDTLSGITFHTTMAIQPTLRQFNAPGLSLDSWLVSDFDADGAEEIAATYTSHDTAYMTIQDPYGDTILPRFALGTGVDRNGNGSWDGRGFLLDLVDLNGDGCDDIVASVITGYDYYPRQVMAVDWINDSIMWEFSVSGHVSDLPPGWVTKDPEADSLILVFAVASLGNTAETP
ncbi:hypothetical protein GF420_04800, partial [candidate division GN15 bacterium]|nr:hypothetical protein [candidate division GN15 bacterium]